MKKILKCTLLSLFLLCIASCKEGGLAPYETEVTINAKGENGKPLNNISVIVVYNDAETTPKSIVTGKTDALGVYKSSARGLGCVKVKLYSHDYYPIYTDSMNIMQDYQTVKKSASATFTLRKIINLTALHAKTNDVVFPDKNKWVGFDLKELNPACA